ncbi:MAG: hypothetical protein R3B07_11355 [Polyangiaceae bacterium]
MALIDRPAGIPAAKIECHIGIAACRSSSPLRELAAALALDDQEARRLALRSLDGCFPGRPGALRAVRADLEPDCADYMVETYASSGAAPPGEIGVTLAGLRIASWLRRVTWPRPPAYSGKATSDAARRFLERRMEPWLAEQEKRLTELEALTSSLPRGSYADAVTSGDLFRLRRELGRTARGFAIRAPMKARYEFRLALYGQLDQRLKRLELERHYALASQLASDWGLIRHPRALHWPSDDSGLQLSCLKFIQLPPIPESPRTVSGPLAHWFAADAPDALEGRVRAGLSRPERRKLSALESPELAAGLGRMYLELGLLYPTRSTFERASWYLRHAETDASAISFLAELLASGPTRREDWIAPQPAPKHGCVPLADEAIERAKHAQPPASAKGLWSCDLMLLGLRTNVDAPGCPQALTPADPLRWLPPVPPEFSWLAPPQP